MEARLLVCRVGPHFLHSSREFGARLWWDLAAVHISPSPEDLSPIQLKQLKHMNTRVNTIPKVQSEHP